MLAKEKAHLASFFIHKIFKTAQHKQYEPLQNTDKYMKQHNIHKNEYDIQN